MTDATPRPWALKVKPHEIVIGWTPNEGTFISIAEIPTSPDQTDERKTEDLANAELIVLSANEHEGLSLGRVAQGKIIAGLEAQRDRLAAALRRVLGTVIDSNAVSADAVDEAEAALKEVGA